MSINSKYLFVFNYLQETPIELFQQVKQCKTVLQAHQNITKPIPYLLYVMPRIPHFALCTPQMIKQFAEETLHAKKLLSQLSEILQVPENHCFLRMGTANWQARLLAKELAIQHIVGQSKNFEKIMGWVESLREYFSPQMVMHK